MRLTEQTELIHRKSDTHLKERLAICNEEDTDGRATVTTDEERVLHVN